MSVDYYLLKKTLTKIEEPNPLLLETELENLVKYAVRVNNATVAMQIIAAACEVHPYLMDLKNQSPIRIKYLELMMDVFLEAYPGSSQDIKNITS